MHYINILTQIIVVQAQIVFQTIEYILVLRHRRLGMMGYRSEGTVQLNEASILLPHYKRGIVCAGKVK